MNTNSHINLNVADWIAMVLVTIGAINWGLVGIAGFIGGNLNLVNLAFGGIPLLENLVYLVVGLAGLYLVYFGYQLFSARTGDTVEAAPKPRAQ